MPAATAPTSNGTERGPLVITGIEFALQQNLPDGWWKAGNEPRRRLQVYRPRGFRPAGVYCRQRPLPRGVVGEESGDGGRRHDERPHPPGGGRLHARLSVSHFARAGTHDDVCRGRDRLPHCFER